MKKRNKKRNPLKALKPALENVAMYSCHCWDEMQVKGVDHPVIMKAIFNQQHKFNIMLLVFCRDGVKSWVDHLVVKSIACKSREFQDHVDPIMAKMIAAVNPKHYISSGWYCVLTDKIDLLSMKDDITNHFIDNGALDRNVCNLAWSMRPESEK